MTATVLTVTDLFTPAPSGVSNAGAVPAPGAAVPGSWLATEYNVAAIVQLPTTAFQPGGPERTILAISAVCYSQDDALISLMAQGQFLSSAATGSVTYQTLQSSQLVTVTVYATPDPSIPSQNPTGAPGWLDLLGQSVYDTTRLPASYATGQLAIVNLSGSSVGPYAQGTYHVGNVNGSTYANQGGSLSIPAATSAAITAVSGSNASTIITSTLSVSVGQAVYVNVPAASGVSGLGGVFGLVTATAGGLFTIGVGSSGTYTGSGGTAYTCTSVAMTADVQGTGSAAAPGTVTTTITQNAGVYCSNLVPWGASNWESNLAYAARCRLALAALSPNGPSQAYEYVALSAAQLLAGEYTFTNGGIVAANAYSTPATGIETVVVASATPASTTLGAAVTPGCALNNITGITNANPAVVTCAGPIGIGVGGTMTATLSGVLGTLGGGVNGSFQATYVSANSFSIPVNTTGLSSFTGGGQVEGGDLGAVDALIQSTVVPDAIIGAITVSALALPIAVVAMVTVPATQVAAYKAAAPPVLQAYFVNNPELPIGGVISSSETVPVSFEQIVAALINAGIPIGSNQSYVIGTPVVTVNGGTSDVAFPSDQYQALLSTLTLNVVGT